jgi:hypothetical protein
MDQAEQKQWKSIRNRTKIQRPCQSLTPDSDSVDAATFLKRTKNQVYFLALNTMDSEKTAIFGAGVSAIWLFVSREKWAHCLQRDGL